jgi:cytochrome c oxidase cbb3-type subunit IV
MKPQVKGNFEMDYNNLRHFADSWGLLAMALFFIGAALFAFRPGSKKLADDAANIPFKEDK